MFKLKKQGVLLVVDKFLMFLVLLWVYFLYQKWTLFMFFFLLWVSFLYQKWTLFMFLFLLWFSFLYQKWTLFMFFFLLWVSFLYQKWMLFLFLFCWKSDQRKKGRHLEEWIGRVDLQSDENPKRKTFGPIR